MNLQVPCYNWPLLIDWKIRTVTLFFLPYAFVRLCFCVLLIDVSLEIDVFLLSERI